MQAIKNITLFVAAFAVILCLLAFVTIDVLLNGILVMCALVFLVYIVVESRE